MNVIDITSELQATNSKIRLAAYCRVSSDSADQLHSFASQIRYYKDYERKNPRYQLVDIYADEGITGTSMVKRDEFNRMIRDCKKGKIDRIIVKSVSRFARNTQELLTAVRMLKEIGVSVCFEEQDIDTDKLNIEMILTFPGMAAQQESESISGICVGATINGWNQASSIPANRHTGTICMMAALLSTKPRHKLYRRCSACSFREQENRKSPPSSTQEESPENMVSNDGIIQPFCTC